MAPQNPADPEPLGQPRAATTLHHQTVPTPRTGRARQGRAEQGAEVGQGAEVPTKVVKRSPPWVLWVLW